MKLCSFWEVFHSSHVHAIEFRGNLCCPGLVLPAVPERMNSKHVVTDQVMGRSGFTWWHPGERVPESKLGFFFSLKHSVTVLTVKTQFIFIIQGLGNKLRQDSLERGGVPPHGDCDHLSPAVLTAHRWPSWKHYLGWSLLRHPYPSHMPVLPEFLNSGRWPMSPVVTVGVSSDSLSLSLLILLEGEQN